MEPIRSRSGEPMRCPNCGARLVEVERVDVLIDACPECRGVWLDRGEIDRILTRERQLAGGGRDPDEDFFREVEGRRPADPDRRPRGDEEYGRKRRRRSLLDELLDFD